MPGPARASSSPPSPSTPARRRFNLTGPELVEGVRRCGAALGGAPSATAYRRWARQQHPHLPGPEVVVKRVGRWSDVLKRAGFVASEQRHPDVIEDNAATRRAIDALRRFAQHADVDGLDASDYDVAQRLSRGAYDIWRHDYAPDAPALATVQVALGLWPAALHAAGLASTAERPRKRQRFTDNDVLKALRAAAAELGVGARLGLQEYQAWRVAGPGTDVPTSRLVWERFGSWTAAMAAAGLAPERAAEDKAPAINGLQRFIADGTPAGVNPEAYLVWAARQKTRQPTARALIAEHGSWASALESAGAERPRKSPSAPAWENDDMLDAVRAWALAPSTDPQLTSDRYRAWERSADRKIPTDAAIVDRFGGWRKALRAAGVEQQDEDIRARFRRLAPDAIERALEEFAAAYPDVDLRSQYRYSAWRAANAPWAPAKRTLTLKFGNWGKVKDRLDEVDRERAQASGAAPNYKRRRPTGHRKGTSQRREKLLRGIATAPGQDRDEHPPTTAETTVY